VIAILRNQVGRRSEIQKECRWVFTRTGPVQEEVGAGRLMMIPGLKPAGRGESLVGAMALPEEPARA